MIQPGDNTYKMWGFSGTTRNWVITDSEELYKQNIKEPKYREQLDKLGFDDTSITYEFNSEGFRSDKFNLETERDSIVFLGCSLTVGIGIPLEDTWAYKVAKSLGLRCYNLGVGGTSADGCFRLANHWLPILKPKYVCMLTPAMGRMELIDENNIYAFLPLHLVPNDEMRKNLQRVTDIVLDEDEKKQLTSSQINSFYTLWATNKLNIELNLKKNQLAIRRICDENNIKIFDLTTEDNAPIFNPVGFSKKAIQEKARDLMHPGKQWHAELAEKFLKIMQEQH